MPNSRSLHLFNRSVPACRVGARRLLAALILGIVAASVAHAFPPAPYFTVYGDVRDELGNLIPADGTSVIFSYGGKQVGSYPITAAIAQDYNYQIRIRLDMNRLGTASYTTLAANSGATYTLAIDVGGVTYYPLELATPPVIGAPTKRVRLDLTIGVDANNDGLPDAWQAWQLYLAGLSTTDLDLVGPSGDLDADGLSNLHEYIAGTYAADAAQTFYLKVTQSAPAGTWVEFFGITSKHYTMEASNDLNSWSKVDFAVNGGAAASYYRAPGVGLVNAYITASSDTTWAFYRLNVR